MLSVSYTRVSLYILPLPFPHSTSITLPFQEDSHKQRLGDVVRTAEQDKRREMAEALARQEEQIRAEVYAESKKRIDRVSSEMEDALEKKEESVKEYEERFDSVYCVLSHHILSV